jgi:hypothetical protein
MGARGAEDADQNEKADMMIKKAGREKKGPEAPEGAET